MNGPCLVIKRTLKPSWATYDQAYMDYLLPKQVFTKNCTLTTKISTNARPLTSITGQNAHINATTMALRVTRSNTALNSTLEREGILQTSKRWIRGPVHIQRRSRQHWPTSKQAGPRALDQTLLVLTPIWLTAPQLWPLQPKRTDLYCETEVHKAYEYKDR